MQALSAYLQMTLSQARARLVVGSFFTRTRCLLRRQRLSSLSRAQAAMRGMLELRRLAETSCRQLKVLAAPPVLAAE